MKLKNLTYLTTNFFFIKCKLIFQLSFLFTFISIKSQNIANYINNGGFEQYHNCIITDINSVKYWRSIDSISWGNVGFYSTCFPNVPSGWLTYQWPRSGQNFCYPTFLCQPPQCSSNRGYARNRLKANLIAGKTYCVKFYVNIGNPATYGIDGFGAYFGDNNTLDTITKFTIPLTYLIPQVQNPANNIISDTLNWTLITGTFVSNGTEKNCVIGNFKSDLNTNKILINPSNLPFISADCAIDDVSCIPLDLPAYAGADTYCIPGNTVYIGRPQDVGIDEACVWYNITNTTTPIGNAAGIVVSPVTTSTYIVKQDICGIIKWDTVVVYQSALGIVSSSGVENSVKIYPSPANEILNVECQILNEGECIKLKILNNLGQIIREEVLRQAQQPNGVLTFEIKTDELPNGVYLLNLSSLGTRDLNTDSSYRRNDNVLKVSKRFVINR